MAKYQKDLSKIVCELKETINKFDDEFYKCLEAAITIFKETIIKNRNILLCGNGGSAGNAIHIANDFLYGIGNCGKGSKIPGIRVSALSANPAILTCLGNDIGFENIFSYQLKVKSKKNDLLIALSGSGNSPNVISAINTANQIGLKTFAILAFDGGKCNDIVNYPLHFNINDMQIAEDLQLIIGHLCMQWLSNNKSEFFG